MRHDPASAAIVIMMRSLKMYGMAQAVEDLIEQGSPAFEAAVPILSQLLKAEVAEREVRSIAYHLKAARFPAYKDLAGFDFAASEINEALVRQLHRGEFIDGGHNVVLIGGPGTGKTQVSIPTPGLMPRGRRRSSQLRRRDRGSDPVPGMPGTGSGCRREPGRFGLEDPERSEDRLVTVTPVSPTRPRRRGKCNTIVAARPPRARRPRMTNLTVPAARGSSQPRSLAMTQRTIGVDLAIRGDHVAQILDDGRPLGPPLRFRHDPVSLDAFVARATAGLGDADSVQAVMEPTGMSWFPVAHRLADAGVEVARVKGKRVKALRRYPSEHGPDRPRRRPGAGRHARLRGAASRPGAYPRRQEPCAPAAHQAARPLPGPDRRQQAAPDRPCPLGLAGPRARPA
jgi:hypothetical protein